MLSLQLFNPPTFIQNAAANTTNPFGTAPDNWNSAHFLDLAEFTAAFAIGYDWLYDYWTAEQRTAIMWSIINLGLYWGDQAYNNPQSYVGWWRQPGNNVGNWNCVCNSGLSLGALAIVDVDPTGLAAKMLALTVPNAVSGCAHGPEAGDGTWSETANYWYFGTTVSLYFYCSYIHLEALLTDCASTFLCGSVYYI